MVEISRNNHENMYATIDLEANSNSKKTTPVCMDHINVISKLRGSW